MRARRGAAPPPAGGSWALRTCLLASAFLILFAPPVIAAESPARPPAVERLAGLGDEAHRRGNFKDAAARFREAIVASAAPDPGLFVCRIDALRLAGSDETAEREFAAFARSHPGSAEVLFLAAGRHALEGRCDEAIRGFREALALRPGYLRARTELAVELVKAGRVAEGFAEAARLAEDPDAASDARYVVALAHRLAGDDRGALPWFEAALALRPRDLYAAAEVVATRYRLGENYDHKRGTGLNDDFIMARMLPVLFDGVLGDGDSRRYVLPLDELSRRRDFVEETFLALLMAARGRDGQARRLAARALERRPFSRFARLAAGVAFRKTAPPRTRELLLAAFERGGDADPALYARLAGRFGLLDPALKATAAAARGPAPPKPPFPLLPRAER